jgi:hypothetical protein
MLDKKTALYDRDEDGNLLPTEVEIEIDETVDGQLEYKGEKIKVIPIPRGKLKRLFSNIEDTKDSETDFDGKIILEHCIVPKFDETEIEHLKPALSSAIVNTIFRESGITSNKSRKAAVLEAEDEFAKNS